MTRLITILFVLVACGCAKPRPQLPEPIEATPVDRAPPPSQPGSDSAPNGEIDLGFGGTYRDVEVVGANTADASVESTAADASPDAPRLGQPCESEADCENIPVKTKVTCREGTCQPLGAEGATPL